MTDRGGRRDRASRAGHAGRGRRSGHAARPGRDRRRRTRTGSPSSAAASGRLTVVTDRPLIDPAGPGPDALPRRAGPVDDRGDRLLLRHRDALVPRRVLRAREGRGRAARRRPVRRHGGGRGPRSRPARTASSAIFSNVMDAKRWVQASPSFLGFDVDDPPRSGRVACIRAIEEQAAYASRGHLAIIEELTGRTVRRDRVHRRRRQGPRSGRRSWPTSWAWPVRVPVVKESTALGRGDLRRDRRRALRRPRRGRRRGSSASSGRSSPTRPTRAAYDEHFARWRERLPARSSSSPRRASSARCGGRPAPDAASRTPCATATKGPVRDARSRHHRQQAVPRGRPAARASSSSSRARPPTTGGCSTGSPGSSGRRAAGP